MGTNRRLSSKRSLRSAAVAILVTCAIAGLIVLLFRMHNTPGYNPDGSLRVPYDTEIVEHLSPDGTPVMCFLDPSITPPRGHPCEQYVTGK